MKTEKQVEEKLESLVARMNEETAGIKGEPTEEQKATIFIMMGQIVFIGWLLDCEEELKQLMTTLKMA